MNIDRYKYTRNNCTEDAMSGVCGAAIDSRASAGAPRRSVMRPVALSAGIALAILIAPPAQSRATASLTAVATSEVAATGGESRGVATPSDPWAGFNRRAFGFNRFLDKALIGPVARAYKRVTPAPLRRGVSNVVNNLREPSTALNGLVQGRPKVAAKAVGRFVANSTVGVLGLFDVAGDAGLEREGADFGQTLGRYGVPNGPYLYVPIVGSLSVRDAVGSVINTLIDPVSLATGGPGADFAVGRGVARGLDARADADDALRAIHENSTDPYATTRSAYLQHRNAVVRAATGAVQELPDFDDLDDPPPPLEDDTTAPESETPVAASIGQNQ